MAGIHHEAEAGGNRVGNLNDSLEPMNILVPRCIAWSRREVQENASENAVAAVREIEREWRIEGNIATVEKR